MTAVIVPSPVHTDALYRSVNLDALALQEPFETVLVSPILVGTVSVAGESEEDPFAIDGELCFGPADVFYSRVYLEPVKTNLGLVTTDQVVTYRLWNAWRDVTKDFTAWVGTNATDMVMSGSASPPYTMAPLEELTFTVLVSSDGSPVIGASFVWTVDGEDYTATIEGTRSGVFGFAPNWNGPVTETLEWKTDVHRAYDGSEQRVALRSKPRRGFEYRSLLWGQDVARLRNTLHGRQNRAIAMPVWTDKAELTVAGSIGDTALTVDSVAGLSFATGQAITLYAGPGRHEAALVEDITGNVLTIRDGLVGNWPAGTKVFPLVVGRVPGSVALNAMTGSVTEAALSIVTDPVSTEVYMPVTAAPTTYNGYEVILTQPNWARPVNGDHTYAFETIDSQTGAIDYIDTELFPRETRRYSWTLNGRAEITAFRAFLARRKGQLKPFYAPTWGQDFKVATPSAGPSQTFIDVEDNEFFGAVGVSPTRDRLLIRLRSGQDFYRRITGVADLGGGVTRLSLNATLGLNFDPEDFRAVHVLQLCRLAADRVSLQWHTSTLVTVETNLITVRE